MTNVAAYGQGAILPEGTIQKVELSGASHTVKIVSIDPENGYDAQGDPLPSENDMVTVEYPDGYRKSHQIASGSSALEGLVVKVSTAIKARYNVTSFDIQSLPNSIVVDGEIVISGVQYDA